MQTTPTHHIGYLGVSANRIQSI